MEVARRILAPRGVLVAGINLSNFLLVTEPQGPRGVSPSMATLLAEHLDAHVDFTCFPNPATLTANSASFAVGLVANEEQRAEHLAFSRPYALIEATLLSRVGGDGLADLDKPGVKIAVSSGAAYDLYLSRHLRGATLVRANGLDASYELFRNDPSIAALAGLRPKLVDYPDDGVLLRPFSSVQQAIGIPRSLVADGSVDVVMEVLDTFVADCLAKSVVADLIRTFGVDGRLTLPVT